MSLLARFLGIGARDDVEDGETETVRRIASELDRLPPRQARKLAALSFVLARVAHADLAIEDEELSEMRSLLCEVGELSSAEAGVVVELAQAQARHHGGTENYVVTRELRRITERTERIGIVDCLFAVAASDGSISSAESDEVVAIAQELGFTRGEAIAMRSGWREKLSILKS